MTVIRVESALLDGSIGKDLLHPVLKILRKRVAGLLYIIVVLVTCTCASEVNWSGIARSLLVDRGPEMVNELFS